MYLTKEMIREALTNVQTFEHELDNLFASYDYSLRDNLGRRNALCSQAQEKELAKVLSKTFESVIHDGAPGKPDIFIGDINKELECKLTSGNRSSSVSYSLQTDWQTLRNKGSIDYLYVLCDEGFEKFCVLYFDGLTVDDFHPPASGSRGKSRMKKAAAMKKAVCLHGSYTTQNEKNIKNYVNKVSGIVNDHVKNMTDLKKDYFVDRVDRENSNSILEMKDKLEAKLTKNLVNFSEKIDYWTKADPRFSFTLEPLDVE